MKNKFPITGTFIDEITYDIPSSNWNFDKWRSDLDHMQDVGMDTLVLIRGGFAEKLLYPSAKLPNINREDLLGFFLDEAGKRGMDVFVGLYTSDLDWGGGDAATEIRKNRIFVHEVMERYGDRPAFRGWYIPHEVGEDRLNITEVMAGLSKLCKEAAPDKLVLISPYFKSAVIDEKHPMSPEEAYDEWDSIFSRCAELIDICAFQDGTAPILQMESYLEMARRLCTKYHMRHWSNVELFERDPRCVYYPIPFDTLRTKLSKSAPYIEKAICFEFSHFLSPQSIYPSARNLHELYTAYYGD